MCREHILNWRIGVAKLPCTQEVNMKTKRFKGQAEMMEYLLMTVFTIVILLAMMFFLFGFEIGRSTGSEAKDAANKLMVAVNVLAQSDILAKDGFILDDSKLVNFLDQSGCEDITKIIGQEACVIVNIVKISSSQDQECLLGNYGKSCNKWTMCRDVCNRLNFTGEPQRGIEVPLNVYRKLEDKVDLAKMKIQSPVKQI